MPPTDRLSARVHVPVVPGNGDRTVSGPGLTVVLAGDGPVAPEPKPPSGEAKRAPKGILPHLEALHSNQATASGEAAVAAVNALGLSRSRAWLPRWGSGQPVWPRLSVEEAMHGVRSPLTKDTCHSAELGLALATLLSLTHRGDRAGTIIATGAVGMPQRWAGCRIEPVAHLASKFALILEQFGSGRSPALRGPGHIFTPVMEAPPKDKQDGEAPKPVAETYAKELAAIAKHGFAIHHIATLREAAEILRATRLPAEPWQVWTTAAVATLAGVGCLAGGLYHHGLIRDLPLTLSPVEALPSPVRAAAMDAGGFRPLPACTAPADGRTALRIGESLLFKVAADGPGFDRLPYAIVWVDEGGGVKVMTDGMIGGGRVAADGTLNVPLSAIAPPGKGLAAVVARRLFAFDPAALRAALQSAMDGAPENGRLNAAASVLRASAPGYVGIPIDVLPSTDPGCRDG